MNGPTAIAVHGTDPEDFWLYLIERPAGARHDALPTADGRALTPLAKRDWYAGPPELLTVAFEARPGSTIRSWSLPDGVTFPNRAATLTLSEFAALDEDDPARPWYEADRDSTPQPDIVLPLTRYDVDRFDLDAYPLAWTAKLPYAVRDHRELHPAFPGSFSGVRKYVADHVSELPRVARVLGIANGTASEFTAYVIVDLPEPMQTTKPKVLPSGRKSTKQRTVIATQERAVTVKVPDVVAGPNADTAWEKVRELTDQALALCSIEATVCPECRGAGLIYNGEGTG